MPPSKFGSAASTGPYRLTVHGAVVRSRVTGSAGSTVASGTVTVRRRYGTRLAAPTRYPALRRSRPGPAEPECHGDSVTQSLRGRAGCRRRH
eukprot:747747-Hanusia_phi.AAC.7